MDILVILLTLSTICVVSCLGILKVRDNVVAAILLLISAITIATISYIFSNIFLTILVLIVYVGVVITFIIVAASAIELKSPVIGFRRALPIIILGSIIGISIAMFIKHLCVKYPVSKYSLSVITSSLINNSEYGTITILLIVLTVVMFLIVIQLCRRGVTQ